MSMPEEFDAKDFDEQVLYEQSSAADAEKTAPEPEQVDDVASIPQTPEERILELEEEVLSLKDKLLRSLADKENIRKRAEKERNATRIYAIEKFAADLIAVGDNLERAKMSLTPDMRASMGDAGKALSEGVEMTMKALQDTLGRHGVKPIDAEPGTHFDPNLHQAVSQIPSDQNAGAIAMTFQPGWQIGERTLRAAMVAVSAGKPTTEPQKSESDGESPHSDQNSVPQTDE